MIKVYVDKLNHDGTIGMATNRAMILRNVQTLEVIWKGNTKESVLIFPAGRFICAVTITSENELAMIFMNFKKNKQKALFAANKYLEPTTQKVFMEVFEKVNKTYDEKYREVEMVLDINFIPDIIEN